MMDAAHNLYDEMELIFLYLAFILSQGVSRNLLRTANLFNTLGLVMISGLLAWQAVERFLHPTPVEGVIPIVVGTAAAAANWGWQGCCGNRGVTVRRSVWPISTISATLYVSALPCWPASW
jgi:hypothetical protein